jgi:hypothetical protein
MWKCAISIHVSQYDKLEVRKHSAGFIPIYNNSAFNHKLCIAHIGLIFISIEVKLPCGGGLEYLYPNPASPRKGNLVPAGITWPL